MASFVQGFPKGNLVTPKPHRDKRHPKSRNGPTPSRGPSSLPMGKKSRLHRNEYNVCASPLSLLRQNPPLRFGMLGIVSPGLYQVNVGPNVADGDQPIVATFCGKQFSVRNLDADSTPIASSIVALEVSFR